MAEKKFFHESFLDTANVHTFMQSLIDGIGKQRVVLSTEDDEMVLNPKGLLKVTVKAKKKNEKNRINLKITWEDEKKPVAADNKRITISS